VHDRQRRVAKVERLLNARPRKSLGFRSPQEVFDSLTSMRWQLESARDKYAALHDIALDQIIDELFKDSFATLSLSPT
jgi:hypothetical protein